MNGIVTFGQLSVDAATTGPAEGVPITALVVLALASLALAAALSAGEEAARSMTRSAAHEAQLSGTRGARVAQELAASAATPIRIAGLVRVLAEMSGAVCLTLVMVGVANTWWQVLVGSIAVSALLMVLVVGSSPRSLGRRQPFAVLAVVGPLMLLLARPWRSATGTETAPAAEADRDESEPLRSMVDRVSESDEIDDDEREMLRSIFELGSTMVREVMVPRTDMVTIGTGSPLTKARTLFVRSGFSRIPVIGEGVDDLRGVLYLKDLLKHSAGSGQDQDQDTVDLIARQPVLVPETKPVDDLLEQMRSSGIHIAFAFDEWGGIAGLVTIEDILEELVGELTDEHDRTEPEIKADEDGSYLVPARLGLDELGELFDIAIDEDDVDTVAGLLAKALGKVPIEGSTAQTHGLELTVDSTGGRRRQIETVRVCALTHHDESESV
ncbi:MAG: hemolysin family protein [Beutenbergiaceae bacterium]